jgi:hypothetical protein
MCNFTAKKKKYFNHSDQQPSTTAGKPSTPRLQESTQSSGFFLGTNTDSEDDYDSEIEFESPRTNSDCQQDQI